MAKISLHVSSFCLLQRLLPGQTESVEANKVAANGGFPTLRVILKGVTGALQMCVGMYRVIVI